MKRRKVRELVMEVLEVRAALPERAVTYDTLSVDFEQRVVRFRGRTFAQREALPSMAIPILSTDKMIVTKDGSEVV